MKDQYNNNNNQNNMNRDNQSNMKDNQNNMNRDSNMSDNDKVLVGIFESENETIKVVKELTEMGYRENEITVVARDKDQMDRIDDTTDAKTKTQGGGGGGIGTGAAVGGALGGAAAALPALGLLAIPGVGPFLAAGPIAGIIGGVVAGGVAGGLVGGLIELGVNEEDAKEYEHQIEQGKMLVLVENKENWRDDVNETYKQNNSLVRDRSLV